MKLNKPLKMPKSPSPPFVREGDGTASLMLDVIIALVPTAVWICIFNGPGFLVTLLLCMGLASVLDAAACAVTGRFFEASDLSAAVTGMLTAICFVCFGSQTTPGFAVYLAVFIAIVPAKQLFGGTGKNILNPALTGTLAVLLVFRETAQEAAKYSVLERILGKCPGNAGVVSPLLLLLGGLYLLCRRVTRWQIPAGYIAAACAAAALLNENGADMIPSSIMNALLESGVLLGVFFLADDYATTPCTRTGRLVFGIGCGALTVCALRYGAGRLSVPAAILIMNLLARPLDMLCMPKVRIAGKTEKADGKNTQV